MALQAEVQYVKYPVNGTAAWKVEGNTQHDHVTPVYNRRRTERDERTFRQAQPQKSASSAR